MRVAGAGEIRVALAVLTVAALAVTCLSVQRGAKNVWSHLVSGGIIAMLASVFVPHVPAAVLFRGYAPRRGDGSVG